MVCKNKVTQLVPRGYTYKAIKLRCGSTDIHGDTILCDDCHWKNKLAYPQGWTRTPGDTCPHGTYIGDRGGPDYLCYMCEEG